VFSAKNAEETDVSFFIDGYTDICGKFQYAKDMGNELQFVKKFAILVQSDHFGSKILQASCPNGPGDVIHQ
jgi:hypothetical protein